MTALLDSIGLGGYTKWLVLGAVALVALGFALRWVLFAAKAAKLRRSVSLAVKSLWLHKLRSFLSVLGIIIGTSAVIALMAFGEGSMQDALEDIKRQGATNIIVRSVKPPDESATASKGWVTTYGLVQRDLDKFETFGDVIVRRVPLRVLPTEVRYLERMANSRVIGTIPQYTEVNKLEMASGRFLVETDDENMENVCVLGSEVADKLFPFEDPLGKTVGMKGQDFRVIGVIKERMPTGGSGGSQAAEEFNRDVYIPFRTSRGRFGGIIFTRSSGSRSAEKVEISQVTLTVSDIDHVRPVGDAIRTMLEFEHPRKDWAVTVPLDRLEEAERAKNRFTNLLVLIASISLVVGGIGIMNIMLATVTERTREIGIRRALGAKQKDITLQFLVEAVVQTTIGGICGVILGLGMVYSVPIIWKLIAGTSLPAAIHVPSIFLSLFVSVGVGVLFGWYPARRAARLDPIEALRHD
jgi:putative ABC transport system permease protein